MITFDSLSKTIFTDRVCQQQGISLWVPFQNAATAVTNLYKGKYDIVIFKKNML